VPASETLTDREILAQEIIAMHMLSLGPKDHLIFNVDAPVGLGSAGEDVFLVQFLIRSMAESSPASISPEIIARMKNVPLNGFADDDTVDGIMAVQERMQAKNPGTIVDGRVSPARGEAYGPKEFWTIVTLNSTVRKNNLEKWPRLHEMKDCPDAVKNKVLVIV
jgi:hypothetical protein